MPEQAAPVVRTSGRPGYRVVVIDDLSAYPRLTALSAQLSQDAFEDEFDDAMHDLINRAASFHS